MPTFVRFLLVIGAIFVLGYWGLYVLATQFEPQPEEVTRSIGSVKIRRQ